MNDDVGEFLDMVCLQVSPFFCVATLVEIAIMVAVCVAVEEMDVDVEMEMNEKMEGSGCLTFANDNCLPLHYYCT